MTELSKLIEEMEAAGEGRTREPVEWHTSNSWRRLKTVGTRENNHMHKAVIEPTKNHYDGHPELTITEGDQRFVEFCFNNADAILEALKQAQAENERLRGSLGEIIRLEAEDHKLPADWIQQIDACPECRRFKDHPIQQGVCDQHKKHIYERDRNNKHSQSTLIYEAKDLARQALTKENSDD